MDIGHPLIFCCFLCYFSSAVSEKPVADFYWRDYTGIIPDDAVPGGLDVNNKTTYIGQGLVIGIGMLPGMIYPGQKHLNVPTGANKRVDDYIKILCSPNIDAFRWFPAKTSNFHVAVINKYLIRGGYEFSYYLFIGRVAYQGEVIVGKVVAGAPDRPGQAPMFFYHNDKEILVEYYEVLTYDEGFFTDPPLDAI